MAQDTVIHLHGDMGEAVEIVVQEHPADGTLVEDGRNGQATDVQDDNSDVITVFLPQNTEATIGPKHDHLKYLQVPVSNNDHMCALSDALFDVALSELFGYVNSLERAEKVRRNYEVCTNTSYVAVSNVRPNFGQTELCRANHRIYWEEPQQDTPIKSTCRIKFDGVPFVLLAKRVLDCQHGRAWNRQTKDKEKPERKRRKKQCIHETRKLGCLANITMREVMCFPEFMIDDNSEYKRKLASKKLRSGLKEGLVQGEKRIYIDLPEMSSHNHPIDQNARVTHQALDERVLKKLQELVTAGVVDVDEMSMHLQDYVKNELCFGRPCIPLGNRRYFPSKFTIRTHIHRCCTAGQPSLDETSQFKIQGLQSENMAMPNSDSVTSADEIGKTFCQHYYAVFDSNRAGIIGLYTDISVMTFEGEMKIGCNQILDKLMSLKFKTVQHLLTSVDAQPTIDDSILISALGQLKTDEDSPHSFHQTFLIKKSGDNYFILNDLFRLHLHNC